MIGEAVNSESNRPETVKPQTKPKRRFRLGCLGWVACLFFLFVFSFICIKLCAAHALKVQMTACRAKGDPVTWSELLASFEPVPDEENAALVLAPFLDWRRRWQYTPASQFASRGEQDELGCRPSRTTLQMKRLALAENESLLKALHEAATRPHTRWPLPAKPPLPWSGMGVDMEDLDNHAWNGEGLYIEAELHAAQDRGADAADSTFASLRLMGSAAEAPGASCLISQPLRLQEACSSVETVLSLCEMPVQDLARLRRECATTAQKLNFRDAVLFHRAWYFWVATEGRQVYFESSPWLKRRRVLLRAVPGIAEMDALCVLRHCTEALAMLDRPPRQQLIESPAMLARREADLRGWGELRFVAKQCWSSSGVNPYLGQNRFKLALANRQHMHVVRTALAVEQFRIEHGRWPDELTDLVPDYLDLVPQDWFAPEGATVGYRRTATGVRVFSSAVSGTCPVGLVPSEWYALAELADDVWRYKDKNRRLPESLSELVPDLRTRIPTDLRTGEPYTYVTNRANPELFIVGGYTGGMSRAEFWKRDLDTLDWAMAHEDGEAAFVFRLLNPERRGATQARFCDEIGELNEFTTEPLHFLGFTAERLRELGFPAGEVKEFESDMRCFREERGHTCEDCESIFTPDVPADTEMEPMP
jgi:hypothetical protein